MKDSPSPPPAPDPTQTAQAQSQSNIATAIANARLNRVNQSTPWGGINYTQGPVDANGVPSYSSNITLSPAQQQLLEQQQGMSSARNQIAQRLLGQVDNRLGQPLDLSGLHGVNDRGQMYNGAVNRAPVTDHSTQSGMQQGAPVVDHSTMAQQNPLQALRSLPPQVLQSLMQALQGQQGQQGQAGNSMANPAVRGLAGMQQQQPNQGLLQQVMALLQRGPQQ